VIELKNSKTTYLGKTPDGRDKFALDCHINAVQMRETGKDWEDIDPTIEELDADGSTINFTRTPMLVKVGKDSKRRIYPDRTDLSYWIEFQKPFASMEKPTRKDRWFYWNFAHAIIGVLITNTSVKFGFRLKDSQAPTSITIPFSTQGITRQGRMLYHNGRVVAELKLPIAAGSNLDVDGELVQKECSVVFGAGQITVSLDPTGLTYPIEIDPPLEVQVGASADDADERESDGEMHPVYTVIQNRSTTSATTRTRGGYRFVSNEFPTQGTTIDIAYLRVYIYDANYDDAYFNIHFEKLADPAAFTTTAYNITNRTITTNSVTWSADGIAAGGVGWYNSPSLCSVGSPAEELFDAFSPTAIVVITRPNADILIKDLRVRAWDQSPNNLGAILHLEYEAGAPPAGQPYISRVQGVAGMRSWSY